MFMKALTALAAAGARPSGSRPVPGATGGSTGDSATAVGGPHHDHRQRPGQPLLEDRGRRRGRRRERSSDTSRQ